MRPGVYLPDRIECHFLGCHQGQRPGMNLSRFGELMLFAKAWTTTWIASDDSFKAIVVECSTLSGTRRWKMCRK